MIKMNTLKKTNNLDNIASDINYLQHFGVKGMSWYSHQFGKWQPQAVYAGGQPDPNAQRRDVKRGVKDATSDYLLVKSSRGDKKAEAARTLVPKYIAGTVAGGLASTIAGELTGDMNVGLVAGLLGIAAGTSAAKKAVNSKAVKSYQTRHSPKDYDKYNLSKKMNLDQTLSKSYRDAYSEYMNALILQYGR